MPVGIGREYIQLDATHVLPSDPNYRLFENLNRALRQAWDRLDALEGRRGTVPLGADINLNDHKVTNSADPSSGSDLVNKAWADAHYGPAAIARALQIAGSNPLNVSQLRGILNQAQPAAAPSVDTTDLTNETDGTLFVVGDILYRVDRSTDPPVAVAVSALGRTLQDSHANRIANYPPANYEVGTIFVENDRGITYVIYDNAGTNVWAYLTGTEIGPIANLPVDLGTFDERFRFLATDTGAHLRWNGTAFVEEQEVTDAATATALSVLSLIHRSSGTPAADFGVGLSYYLDSSNKTLRQAAQAAAYWGVATNAIETATWGVRLRAAGAAIAEFFRVTITGIAFSVGGVRGIFTHANSSDRTYTLPNDSGDLTYKTVAGLATSAVVVGQDNAKIKALSSLGTTTQVLHGNAAGDPTWGAVSLTADATGTLPLANGGTNGTSAADARTNLNVAQKQTVGGSGAGTYTTITSITVTSEGTVSAISGS